jgi:hypothetical protein
VSNVAIPKGRAIIQADGLSCRVSIPARRNLFVILFLGAWLGGWYFGAASALHQLTSSAGDGQKGFLYFWLAGWTLGGFFAVGVLLWTLFGREIIELRHDALVHRRSLLGLGRTRAYDLGAVKDLRLAPTSWRIGELSFSKLLDGKGPKPDFHRAGEFWGVSGGPIAFDYGARTIRCGAGVDEAEAKIILAELQRWNPRLHVVGAA